VDVLPTKCRRKTAGIDIELNYVTVTRRINEYDDDDDDDDDDGEQGSKARRLSVESRSGESQMCAETRSSAAYQLRRRIDVHPGSDARGRGTYSGP